MDGVIPVFPLPPLGTDHDGHLLSDTVFIDGPDVPSKLQVELVRHEMPFVNAADQSAPEYVKDWNHYVGQEPLKRQLRMYIAAAERKMETLPHLLLASPMPGVGKTTLARLIAKEMGGRLTMLVPPFTPQTLYDAAMQMRDWEFLFIDEIHKLADRGPAAAENLLHLLDEKVLYLDDGVHKLADFTVIGATTDADKLPETVVHRFPIGPETGLYFQKYSLSELLRITKNFCDFYEVRLLPETMVAIAKACRGTPRIARQLVEAGRAVQIATDNLVTPKELLDFTQLDADGMSRHHKAYLLAMYQFFGRERDGEWEYIAGEASLMTILRENKQGIARIERFLVESGLVDRTPQGRRLTALGIARADWCVRHGEGLNTE